ncbi:hypothetical protein CJ030_MR4G000579 [Morella rubra]|uniref:Uncharacterized protein n=1 Tax=Morella rubra TaxID=262757 RepID=A0A6A1VWB1_9ROSI|nr:hypothetical protein CJ030_MR4G000579 [Morella rubra]
MIKHLLMKRACNWCSIMRRVHHRVVPLRWSGGRHRRPFGEEAENQTVISKTSIVLFLERPHMLRIQQRFSVHHYCYAGSRRSARTENEENYEEADKASGIARNICGVRRRSH